MAGLVISGLLILISSMAAGVQEVTFYRLRLVFRTDSDWAGLQWQDPNALLTCRLMSTDGDPATCRIDPDRLTIGQPLARARGRNEIGIVVDCAISPGSIGQLMDLQLTKGDIGTCYLDVSAVIGSQVRPIASCRHSGVVQDSNGTNPLAVRIDLGDLAGQAPIEGRIGRPYERMVWAFYYPWYLRQDWSSRILRDRPLVPYSSDDPCAIARHIDQAKAAGIDGFVSSWWGPDSYTDRNLRTLLSMAAQEGFAVSVYFETLREGGPRDSSQILDWLTYLLTRYRDHPALFRLAGRPVIVVWASGSLPLRTWQDVIASLRQRGLDAAFVGMGYDLANLEVFEGIHEYAVFNIPDLGALYDLTSRLVHHYQLLDPDARPRLWIATVQPGYDDRLIPGRKGAHQDRLDGRFYKETFSAAVASDPDWVFITTWNEWWEHTYIEPSALYGDLYLRITRAYAEDWDKGQR